MVPKAKEVIFEAFIFFLLSLDELLLLSVFRFVDVDDVDDVDGSVGLSLLAAAAHLIVDGLDEDMVLMVRVISMKTVYVKNNDNNFISIVARCDSRCTFSHACAHCAGHSFFAFSIFCHSGVISVPVKRQNIQ